VPSAGPSGVAEAYTPTAENPLVPVASAAEVSRRSVIPFGVQDPVPLYHYILWGTIHVLPADDWSLRLPSLLASVACIVAVFFLCRYLFGTEMALVAALFVAVEPIQVATGWMARPYAIANLAVVLSFLALLGLLHARKPAVAALLALGYAACLAVIGYMNALLLFVIVAHLGMVAYAWKRGGEGLSWKTALAVLGIVLGVGALAPEFGYFSQVAGFATAHRAYLDEISPLRVLTVVWHNLTFFGGLLLALAAGAIVRMHLLGGGAEEKPQGEAAAPAPDGGNAPAGGVAAVQATAPAAPAVAPAVAEARPELVNDPLPENDEGVWMGRLWLFLPQALAIVLTFTLAISILQTRYLTYTTLAAAILLAYYATRDASREVRLAVSGVVAVALLAFVFAPTWSLGDGHLLSSDKAKAIMAEEGGFGTKMAPVWKDGDVVLMRSGLPEADFLRNDIPAENRPQVERAMLAPLTLLYPDTTNKPVIALTLSQYRNNSVKTPGADQVKLPDYYNAEFVDRLKQYRRYWMTGVGPGEAPNSWWYLACIVPWMATQLDRGDLLLARNRDQASGERYITVPPNLGPDEPIKGLAPKPGTPVEDLQKKDFENFVHIVKPKEEKK
jgi:4-amino-4-deoxy-L-arabinose transferase-like glycosyltransferase